MPVTNYYSFGDELIGEREVGGTRRNYGVDALGSVTSTIVDGAIENTYAYKPYGGQLQKTGSGQEPKFGWVGSRGYKSIERHHSDLYIRARHYSLPCGSWTTSDPLGPATIDNLYVYTHSSPCTATDESGLLVSRSNCGNSTSNSWQVQRRIQQPNVQHHPSDDFYNLKCTTYVVTQYGFEGAPGLATHQFMCTDSTDRSCSGGLYSTGPGDTSYGIIRGDCAKMCAQKHTSIGIPIDCAPVARDCTYSHQICKCLQRPPRSYYAGLCLGYVDDILLCGCKAFNRGTPNWRRCMSLYAPGYGEHPSTPIIGATAF